MTDSLVVPHPKNSDLADLVRYCQKQIKAYKQSNNTGDSTSCTEIIRRAVQGDKEAFTALMEISKPTIERMCPRKLREMKEDIVQEVNRRLFKHFRNRPSPLSFSTYAAYLVYLNLTINSVVRNMQRGEKPVQSLDLLQEELLHELAEQSTEKPSPFERIEQKETLENTLNLLTNPLEREVLYRRRVLEESLEEIAVALQEKSPGITKRDVSRLAERALRRLQNNPSIQWMGKEMQ